MIFGFTEQQVASFGMTVGLTAFVIYMLFIIGNLAKESKAGKVGTFVLFLVLALGMVGFVAKAVLQSVMTT
jgi:hypothetical protein